MNVWNQAPLVRLIFPFLTGIITAVYLPFQHPVFIFIIILLLVPVSLIVLIPFLNFSYRRSWWFGLFMNSALFLLGYQLTINKTSLFADTHFSKFITPETIVYAKLLQPCIEKERSMKTVMEVMAVKNNGQWINTSGKAMVYIKKDAFALRLKYGDEIIVNTDFKDVPSIQNPGEFNYKRFLAFHNVFQQAYIKREHWVFTGKNSGNKILIECISLRDKLLNVLSSNNIKNDEYAVGAALILGYSDKLDADIISAYSNTGALHVLSVSGLHVAIVYVVFNWCLFFLDKFKHGQIIKALILIILLWLYAALTGLSPSVLRASTMFSFIVIAKAFDRYTNIYNTLAASAFVLLLIDPYLVMEVGFQLSYIAVIGIVYIQPKIYSWFESTNWLLDQLWTITAVSIAAQIATFPLGLHYFHQFPNYFLLSNFIVIPVSTIIIYLGIGLFVFAKIPLMAVCLAAGFNWAVWLLNYSVKMIEQWPHSFLDGISASVLETWLMYGCIILFFCYFMKKKFEYLKYAFLFVIFILCSQVIEQYKQFHQKKLIIYNISNTTAIDFIRAKENILYADSTFAVNENSLSFHVKNNWWDLGMRETKIVSGNIETDFLKIKNNYVHFGNIKLMVINKKEMTVGRDNSEKTVLKIDYLVLSRNAAVKIKEVLKFVDPEQMVFDSSNPDYRIELWKEECRELGQKYYSVPDQGAFIVDL